MPHSIEAIVDPQGQIRPLEPIQVSVPTRAVITLLEPVSTSTEEESKQGSAAAALALLQSSRYARRPPADPAEVAQRIRELRDGWDGE